MENCSSTAASSNSSSNGSRGARGPKAPRTRGTPAEPGSILKNFNEISASKFLGRRRLSGCLRLQSSLAVSWRSRLYAAISDSTSTSSPWSSNLGPLNFKTAMGRSSVIRTHPTCITRTRSASHWFGHGQYTGVSVRKLPTTSPRYLSYVAELARTNDRYKPARGGCHPWPGAPDEKVSLSRTISRMRVRGCLAVTRRGGKVRKRRIFISERVRSWVCTPAANCADCWPAGLLTEVNPSRLAMLLARLVLTQTSPRLQLRQSR
jgi:hypothetical protein